MADMGQTRQTSSPDQPTYDIAIAGGGMAGSTLALALHQAGFRVALVDAETLETQGQGDYDGRASAIAYSAHRLWRRLGLGETLEAGSQPLRRIVVNDGAKPGPGARFSTGAELVISEEDLPIEDFGEPLGWMVENRTTRLALAEALARTDVALLRPAVALEAIDEGAFARLALEDGRSLRARLVIAAEGRRSLVRLAAGFKTVGWAYGQTALACAVQLERPHEGTAWQHFMPSGPLAILPLTGNRASLVWSESADKAKALASLPTEAFESLLARRMGDAIGPARLIGRRFTYPLSLQLSERAAGPRLALLGDAAHGVHPIAGQGLNLGLKDVAALCDVLVEARDIGEDIGSELVLERYVQWRRFDTAGSMAAADLIARGFSNDQPALRLLRDAALTAGGLFSPVRRIFAREAGASLGDAPSLLKTD